MITNPCDQCAYCGKVDVVESGNYSQDLADRSDPKRIIAPWFCSILCNQMLKHELGNPDWQMKHGFYQEMLKRFYSEKEEPVKSSPVPGEGSTVEDGVDFTME